MSTPNDSDRSSTRGGGTSQSGDTKEQMREQANYAARQAADSGKAQLDRHRNTAADEIDKLAESARAAADELGNQQREGLSHYLADAAGGMHGLADNLRNKNADELLREATRMARQNPGLFIAGSIAIGLGISRFARASGNRPHPAQDDQHEDWGATPTSRTGAETDALGSSAGLNGAAPVSSTPPTTTGMHRAPLSGNPESSSYSGPYPTTAPSGTANGRDLTGGPKL